MTTQMHATRVIRLFQDVFRWLPLATVVDRKIFVCHGGISDTIDLDKVKVIDRHKVRHVRPGDRQTE